ncbi:Transcriptional activator HAP3 [Pseudozyma hubeiensis]|nr:Transcriptional activator HAP3 [Pseudozyma hubeiensis]
MSTSTSTPIGAHTLLDASPSTHSTPASYASPSSHINPSSHHPHHAAAPPSSSHQQPQTGTSTPTSTSTASLDPSNLSSHPTYTALFPDPDLPIANISRIMKRSLPENAKIAKDAKECVQDCVSELISFITSEASDKCSAEKRKTINGDDILYAMRVLGFDNYEEILRVYLSRYRMEQESNPRVKKRGKVGKKEGADEEEEDDDEDDADDEGKDSRVASGFNSPMPGHTSTLPTN